MTTVDDPPEAAEAEPGGVDQEGEPGDLGVTYRPLDEIALADVNPRQHDIPALIGAIKRFGYMEPTILDDRTGRLVGGHGRLKALQRMRDRGDPRPSGVRAGDGRWEVAVVTGWASRDDDHAIAALVNLNRQPEKAHWEPHGYAAMLRGLDERSPYLLESAGYTPQDLNDLLRQVGDLPDYTQPLRPAPEWDDRDRVDAGHRDDTAPWDRDPLPPPDRPSSEPEPVTATTDVQDVWLLGPHRLTCADPLDESGTVITALLAEDAQPTVLIVTDPARVDVICMRWQAEGGAPPVREADGEPFRSPIEDDDDAAWDGT